jgi:predicted aspartyl protease
MIMRRLVGAVALLLAAATPVLADDTCHLIRITSLDMNIDEEGGTYVPMTIGGQSVNLLIDTGGIDSMLTRTAVNTLGLHPTSLDGRYVVLFGGQRIDHYALALNIVFGGLTAPSMRFLVMPDGLPAELSGTLAPDILRAYDDDFDFANAKFSLFSPDHCPGRVVYWTQGDYAQIGFATDRVGHISFPVLLDGKEIRTDMDTGSSRSILSLEQAEDLFGFDEKSAALTALPGRGSSHSYKYPFKTLIFGGVTVTNPDIILVSDAQSRLPGGRHFILGMGILRQLHMYIAYHEEKLYVTAASAH